MPRVYKPNPCGKRYKKYPKELLEQALRDYCNGSGSLSEIAQKFGINKSVLYRHSIKNMKTQGGQTFLSKETELAFIKYINLCAGWGYPLETYDLRLNCGLFRHYKEYFAQLRISLNDIPIDNIVNYDETNLADDPDRKQIITKRGTKYPERVMNHTKAAVSIMKACTAAEEGRFPLSPFTTPTGRYGLVDILDRHYTANTMDIVEPKSKKA
ncbi:unnamed protein product [Parnassius mnemosyne]|uniref:HTH psq-type domain-containing protein n=1 Tax=Parnassius mnemosyne TaxID=213953 RepID=A0AAV1KG56_9NEOP